MSQDMSPPRLIGMLIFPRLTQLDMTGPYEVLARLPNTVVHLVAHTLDPVKTDRGMMIVPTVTYADCPQLDVVMVPGGPGQQDLMEDAVALKFLQRQAATAKYVTSVCTGSLVLGAAGLLKGKRAATHWMSMDMLKDFGAVPVHERVVVDGSIITGGGVTAGIDFGLTVAAEIAGPEVAKAIQLGIEYDPHPPFNAGSPRGAGSALTERVTQAAAARQSERAAAVKPAAARLG